MKLVFKQKIFSWLDSYDIFDEQGNTVYKVKEKLSWGHCLKIYDVHGNEVGTVKERVLTFMPKFEVYLGQQYLGCIVRELSLFRPKYDIDYNGWHIEGNFWEWDYEIVDRMKQRIARISTDFFHLSDTYAIDVHNPQDALTVLMFVLAVDAEKCSRTR